MGVYDIIQQQDEAKSHKIDFYLWPEMWRQYSKSVRQALRWRIYLFDKNEVLNIPDQKGVYTFVIQPGIASHPACSYLMYVGKAVRKTLRDRFKDYLNEINNPKGRPKIIRLNKHRGYIFFCCAEIVRDSSIGKLEKYLINAYLPPYNDVFPARVSKVVRGLR